MWKRIQIKIKSVMHFKKIVSLLNAEVGPQKNNWTINKPVLRPLAYKRTDEFLTRTVKIRADYEQFDELKTLIALMTE